MGAIPKQIQSVSEFGAIARSPFSIRPSPIAENIRLSRPAPDGEKSPDGFRTIIAALTAHWGWTGAIFLAVCLGGTNPYYSFVRGMTEIVGAGMIGAAGFSAQSRRPTMALPDWLCLAAVLLVLVQLIPLPGSIWTDLPGREFAIEIDMAVFGNIAAHALSLTPGATLLSGLTLLPAIGAYLAYRTGPCGRQTALLLGLALGIIVAVGLALAQAISARFFPYELADTEYAIGFFTNHNHLPTFLIAGVMLASALLARTMHADGLHADRQLALALCLSAAAAIGLCILLSGSRAGLVLAVLMIAPLAYLFGTSARSRWAAIIPLVMAAALAVVIGMLYWAGDGHVGAFERYASLSDDMRLAFWPVGIATAGEYWPVGSGFGSFADVYAMREPLSLVSSSYINHAHNDYLELAIEGGVMTAILIALFAGWVAWRSYAAFSDGTSDMSGFTARIAALALMPILLHSLVDYPLRTASIKIVFALAVAVVVTHPRTQQNALAGTS